MSYLYIILAYRKTQVPNSDIIRLKMSRSVSGWMGFGFVNHNWESKRSNICQRPWFPEPDLIITLTSVLGPATPDCGGDAGCRVSSKPGTLSLEYKACFYHAGEGGRAVHLHISISPG